MEKPKQAVETKDKAEGKIRNERNIPLSEGFEICFCLIVSEREGGESTGRKSGSQTDGGSVSQQGPRRTTAESGNATQKRKRTHLTIQMQ